MDLNKNTHVMSTQRTKALKKAIKAAPREISTVRGRIFTEVFSLNEDKLLLAKRALPYRSLLENLPVRIYDILTVSTAYLVDGSYNPFMYFRF